MTGAILEQLDQIGDWGLFTTDADLIVTRWNRWLEQRSGIAAAIAIGRPLFEVYPDLVARKVDRFYRQALSGQTVLLSHRFHKYLIPLPPQLEGTGQTYLQQKSRIVPLLEGAKVCGTLTLIEDVSERVAHEAELQSRAFQQAAVAALARSALGGCDMNSLVREVVGHLRETLHADYIEVLELLPDEQSWFRLAGDGWSDQNVPVFITESAPRTHHGLTRDGKGMAVALSPANLASDSCLRSHAVRDGLIAPVRGGKRPFGLLGIYTRQPRQFSQGEVLFMQALADVLGVAAERKRLEDELRLHIRELDEGDKRKDEFLAMLAHELRNPLAPVSNSLQILRELYNADSQVNRITEMMSRHVGQITRIVDDLLDVARITRGKVSLRLERFNLASIVDQAIESVRPLIDARDHILSIEQPPEPIYLDADPARLAQVIGNLLNNAAKYTENGGRIRVATRREGNEVVIGVRDTGVGIAAELLPRVFDLFTQIDRTLDRSQGGLGIGLTLVRRLVELHGGNVAAFSPGSGQGSEFVVRIPSFSDAKQMKYEQKAATQRSRKSSAQKILIVDDNVDAADSLAMLLELTGHKAWTAYDGPAALEAAKKHCPSIVLLDIGLPKMDGYEVARQLRLMPDLADVMLVALTGYGQDDDRRKSHEAGFNHHLIKPVAPDELTRLLQ